MVILAIDYGDARTGIAVCDKLEMLASPVTVIHEKNAENLAETIAKIADEKRAELLLLGLPKNMDGSEGFRAENCRSFAALLQAKTDLPLEFQDERLTTVSAHNALNLTDTRGKKRKEIVDAVSAVIILEDYLRKRKN
ncbi:MAG: Holliday junction resolvase RuvX [Candidatus Fimenecus sp.]